MYSQQVNSRDSAGRITSKTEPTGDYVYSYDLAGRLRTVTENGTVVEEYRYDAAGTRVYEMNTLRNITRNSITYRADDGLLNTGDASYEHDADGFLFKKTVGTDVTGYVYSSRGELLKVTLPQGTQQPKVIDYVHDPLGRRIAKKVDNVIVEKYLWQGMTRLLAVYNGADTLLMRFEYADARMPFAMIAGGATYYLAYDQVGSLRVVADGSGNPVKRIDYDSFGNVFSDSAPGFAVPFGFAGGLYDKDTKLVRFGYRDYDPDTGRWTAKDPIGFAGGDSDLYGYCVGDPVNWIDPHGLSMMEAAVPIAIAVSQLDTALPGPADAVAGAIIAAAWAYDHYPDMDDISAMANDASETEASGGLREGKPDVPNGSEHLRDQNESRCVNSKEFKEFLEKEGISKKGWKYVMEKWRTPDGRIVKRHFWKHPSGKTYYHLR